MVALFVLLTFILFVVIDIFVLRAQKKAHPAFERNSVLNHTSMVFNKYSISSPDNIFVSKGHTWAEKIEDGLVKIGLDDFVMKALGKFTVENIAEANRTVKAGDVILEGAFNGKKIALRSPVSGVVTSVNASLLGKEINDPYADWSVIVNPSSFHTESQNLVSGKQLANWMKDEFRKLKDFLTENTVNVELAGVTMQDGGNVIEGALQNIKEDAIKKFEAEFLTF